MSDEDLKEVMAGCIALGRLIAAPEYDPRTPTLRKAIVADVMTALERTDLAGAGLLLTIAEEEADNVMVSLF